MNRLKLIPPSPPADDPYAPKGRPRQPMPQDLANDGLIVPYGEGGDFAEQLDDVHRAAAVLVRDPLRDVALALQALSYEQKRQIAIALRTSVMRLDTWADLVVEARP